jgi:uncharacterized protein YjiS (DUF1127 family)
MSVALHATQIQFLNSTQRLPLMARWSVAFAVTVTKWDTHWRTRKQLKRLSDHHLRDIGLDALTAKREAIKPFWQD